MSNAKKYAIVYTVDNNPRYISYLIHSLRTLNHSSEITETFPLPYVTDDVDVYVLVYGMDEKVKASVRLFSSIGEKLNFIDCSDYFSKFDVIGRYGYMNSNLSPMTFARLFMPLMDEFKSYEKVLYVDDDTDFSKSPLKGIFNEDLDEYDVGMVYDEFPTTKQLFEPQKLINKKLKTAGYEGDYLERRGSYDYCNAGVTLFNMKSPMFGEGYRETLEKMFEMQGKCDFRAKDQDLMNIWFKVKTFPYSSGYNVFYHTLGRSFRGTPHIIHYVIEEGKAALNSRTSAIFEDFSRSCRI